MADMIEAIIGAAFISGGVSSAFKAAKRLNIQLAGVATYQDLLQHSQPPSSELRNSARIKENAEQVERLIGYKFKNIELLCQALVSQIIPVVFLDERACGLT